MGYIYGALSYSLFLDQLCSLCVVSESVEQCPCIICIYMYISLLGRLLRGLRRVYLYICIYFSSLSYIASVEQSFFIVYVSLLCLILLRMWNRVYIIVYISTLLIDNVEQSISLYIRSLYSFFEKCK